jgi:hypothetical protein
MRFARRSLSRIFQRQKPLFDRIPTADLRRGWQKTRFQQVGRLSRLFAVCSRAFSRVSDAPVDKSVIFAIIRGLFALSRGEKPVCNAVSDALVDNRLRKDAVSTRIEFPDYSGYPSSDNLACVTSVERSIRVCAHKGQAKITPDEMIQEQFLMMLRRGDRFCPGSKAFLRRATIIATYDAKLTRDLSSSVKGRDAFCSTIVIAHFSTTKTTFRPDFNRGFASRLAKDAISTGRSRLFFRDSSRFVRALSRRKTCLQHGFGRAG